MSDRQQAMRTMRMFLIGGSLLALAEYIANRLRNPSLAAVVSFLPISLITCYFVIGRDNMISYQMASIRVCMGTFFVYAMVQPLLRYTNVNRHIIVTSAILLWIAIQYAGYRL